MLVALNRSHVENGLTPSAQAGPDSFLRSVRIDREMTSHTDDQPQRPAPVFLIGEQSFGQEDAAEDASVHTGERRKAEGILM